MNKREYLDKLLSLCTSNQLDIFGRMYPFSVGDCQLDWAITQVENTLHKLNDKSEEFDNLRRTVVTLKLQHKKELERQDNTITMLRGEVIILELVAQRLKNPISVENNEVQERLLKLDALEAGGVDNWEWYGESMRNYNANS